MKILIVTYSDCGGGAAKALFRIAGHLRRFGHEASMLVARKEGQAEFVCSPVGGWRRASLKLRAGFARAVILAGTGSRAADRSLGGFPGGLGAIINASDADVVMLGWVGEETLSIGEIAGVRKPLLWRFSDMWPLTGTEHYVDDTRFARYTSAGAALLGDANDLDAYVFRRKRALWKFPATVIVPSRWMAECARASAIAAGWTVRQVPTPVDTDLFAPMARSQARAMLGLPADRQLVLFGAMGGDSDPRKGWDLLAGALPMLDPNQVSCLVVGRRRNAPPLDCPVPALEFEQIDDDRRMAAMYAAADVVVVPSRIDNLPQSGLEAQACGCPVVAFDANGVREVVEDGVTGILAKPFSAEDLGAAIRALLDDRARRCAFSEAARRRALALWSPESTVPQFIEAFEEARQRLPGAAR